MRGESNQSFIAPLIADRKLIVFWLSVLVLMILKVYEGDQAFFLKHFAQHLEEGPVLDWYSWLYHFISTLILFGVIPVIIIRAFFKNKLSDYGLQLGDWRFGIKATIIAFILLPIPVYFSSQNPEHLQYYPLTTLANASWPLFALWGLSYLPHYIGWEIFFRGYIGLGAGKFHGVFAAISLQTIFSVLMHIGKPEVETWGALFGGIYLGLLTYRTRSVVWAILFHFYLGMINTYFCGL